MSPPRVAERPQPPVPPSAGPDSSSGGGRKTVAPGLLGRTSIDEKNPYDDPALQPKPIDTRHPYPAASIDTNDPYDQLPDRVSEGPAEQARQPRPIDPDNPYSLWGLLRRLLQAGG